MDGVANAVLVAGLLMFLIGYLTGVGIAFRDGRVPGLVCLFVPAALFYHLAVRSRRGTLPLLIIHFGMTLSVLGLALAFGAQRQTPGDR